MLEGKLEGVRSCNRSIMGTAWVHYHHQSVRATPCAAYEVITGKGWWVG